MTDIKPTIYHQHDIAELVEIDTGWSTTFPVAEKNVPRYRRVLIGLGHEVSEHEETTADGIVLRYRPRRSEEG